MDLLHSDQFLFAKLALSVKVLFVVVVVCVQINPPPMTMEDEKSWAMVPFRSRRTFGKRRRPFVQYPRAVKARTPRAPARLRRRNIRTAGFLGIEKKFLDTAWNSVALAASTDGAGGEL